MGGEKLFIKSNYLLFTLLCFSLLSSCLTPIGSVTGLYISKKNSSDSSLHSSPPDSLILNEDKSFKLSYNSYGHPLPDIIYGNWVNCGNRLFLFPENFVRKIVDKKDTSLNDSICISIYDYDSEQYRFHTTFTCYSNGEAIEMSHEATSKNNFSPNFLIHNKTCDSIKVKADELFSEFNNYYRPIIKPKPNTRYTVYSRYTGNGFFTKRDFYFKKRGEFIYVKWDKKVKNKWEKESDNKISKGYLWLEKAE